jgi:hypothetical protein
MSLKNPYNNKILTITFKFQIWLNLNKIVFVKNLNLLAIFY